MIKFFRKIRQQLLTEIKFRKYLIYAIGEIVLVVIGILIALNLNTKKELETDNAHIERILTNVYEDLEKDLNNTINFQIKLYERKDSLSDKVLSKTLKESDYSSDKNRKNLYSTLIEGQVEPYRFETNAYQRLIDNIEIVPEKYIHLVEIIQDVYGDEAIVTNDVLKEEKVFLEQIQNRYQNKYDWYSETEENHYNDKVDYLLHNKQHFNDIRRSQKITKHLLEHLNILKQKASYAYNLIHYSLSLDAQKSSKITDIEFSTFEELEAYTGNYRNETEGNELQISRNNYMLIFGERGNIYKVGKDKFQSINFNNVSLEFIRNTNEEVISISIFIKEKNMSSRDSLRTIKLTKLK
jgi:hypothetical protein